ncbi:MAG TPA: hypothetical protein VHS31_11290 [Tepidisphaeraceae bacterium]|nr:hypothetical protein [Tepidisphaeraceae bacterium]
MSFSRLLTTRAIIAATILLIVTLLLFVRLGHYALWDDEAYTALAARAVLATGDTSAIVGHNLVAFRDGLMLTHLHDRATPPLPAYLAAVSIGMLGDSAFAARLPFALCGLATIAVLLRWVWRDVGDYRAMLILGMAIIGNVSFMLYSRQCRYYGPSMFFTVAIAYLYVHFDGTKKSLVPLLVCSMLLLPTNYIHYVAMYACLAIDYLIWGRHRWRMNWRQWAWLLGPQLLFGAIIGWIWNPLNGRLGGLVDEGAKSHFQWIEIVWLMVRDSNRNEFGPVLLLLAAPILYFFKRNSWLLRAPLAAVPFLVASSILIPIVLPKDVPISELTGDIRYIVPVIPLYFGIGTLVLYLACGRWKWLAVGLAAPIFLTNALNQLVQLDYHVHSTLYAYVGELHHPLPEPYTPTSQWINDHVEENQSIWVVPNYNLELAGYQIYPLMYHAPKAIYAWQLHYPPVGQFEHLPEIHFFNRIMPDYIIAFGPSVGNLMQSFRPPAGVSYQLEAVLNVFWKDMYRPELFWRSFQPIPFDAQKGQGIYIFKKHAATSQPALTPAPSPQPEQSSSDFHI